MSQISASVDDKFTTTLNAYLIVTLIAIAMLLD